MLGLGNWNRDASPGGEVDVLERKPEVKSAPVQIRKIDAARGGFLAEYAELAKAVGVQAPDMAIEEFKQYLKDKDWGVFQLSEVVAYMDKKAARESKDQAGWLWRPLRGKDEIEDISFGTQARAVRNSVRFDDVTRTPASDYYLGPVLRTYSSGIVGIGPRIVLSGIGVYDKIIPLHALRKVAAVEKEFSKAPVKFFVADYAPAPQIEYPDPFLMAVINNPKLAIGVGRFIIDFWDEPGFGIAEQTGMTG